MNANPQPQPTPMTPNERIRALNDAFRQTMQGGQVMLSAGINALGYARKLNVLTAVRSFDSFTPDNDPHEEHDFALIKVAGEEIIFKIDYYDLDLEYGSTDAADPEVTARVMTIMLASEW